MRGSVAAWTTLLQTPNKIDDDTLYFIYESVENPTEGSLYLGKKLISGDNNGNVLVNINDIGDVYIDDIALSDKQILVYSETTHEWVNTSLSTIIDTAIGTFTGATENTGGTQGLVPAPQAGDQNKFLRGDKVWATISIPTFDPNNFDNNNNIITFAGFSSAPVGTVPIKTNAGIEWSTMSAGTITREITTMEDLQSAISNGTADLNTIYMVPTDSVDSSNHYNEYMVISNSLELIGTIGDVDLSDYVTTSVFNTQVGNINTILNGTTSTTGLVDRVSILETSVGNLNNLILTGNNTTIVEEINTINGIITDRLAWHNLENI